jgi:hypothetical protein
MSAQRGPAWISENRASLRIGLSGSQLRTLLNCFAEKELRRIAVDKSGQVRVLVRESSNDSPGESGDW